MTTLIVVESPDELSKDFHACLRIAGVQDYTLACMFRDPPTTTRRKLDGIDPPISRSPLTYIHEIHAAELTKLRARRPSAILALGELPLWLFTGETSLAAFRGYPQESLDGVPLIASWAPSAVARQYSLRTVLLCDIQKAFAVRRPLRRETLVPETPDDFSALDPLFPSDALVACDIETTGEAEDARITEVGFAPSATRAVTIPFERLDGTSYWPSLADERVAWQFVQRVLYRCQIIGHNFAYDMQYLWRNGIACPRFMGDTMLLHHALQPEMRKSLGFLASLYTEAPRWKHIRRETKELTE